MTEGNPDISTTEAQEMTRAETKLMNEELQNKITTFSVQRPYISKGPWKQPRQGDRKTWYGLGGVCPMWLERENYS
jgi:hypothetical protein